MKNNNFTYMTLLALAALPAGAFAAEPQKDSVVAMPWQTGKSYWESATGSRTVSLEDAEKSPVYDLRNKLTGIVPGLEVIEETGSIMPSDNMGSSNIGANSLTLSSRGFQNLVLIVDDVLIPFNQFQFDVNQIESITLLNDATAKAKYGPRASYGALYVKTKKGSYNQQMRISADIRTGINLVDRMPEWVNGYEYASLNNIARDNDGYPMLYDEEALAGYRKGDMFNRQYPSVDYRSLMLRNYMPTSSFGFNMHGGSANVKYNISLNGLNNQDLFVVGPQSNYSKINVGSSISAKIGKWIEANVSFYGLTGFRNGNYGSLTGFRSIPANSFPIALGVSTNDSEVEGISAGNTIYAVSRAHTSNPYAQMVEGGFYTTRYRSADFNATIDFDMAWLLPGLKSKTFVNTNNDYYQKVGKENDYLAYFWDMNEDICEISTHVGTKAPSKSSKGTFTYQNLSLYERLYWDWARDGHKIDLGAAYTLSHTSNASNDFYERQSYVTANADWSYQGRYIVEAVLQYAGSSRYAPENRFAFFPAVSAAWVASKEDFLKGVNWIDNLKIHAGVGSLGEADVFGANYYYRSLYSSESGKNYGPATAYQWFGGDKRTAENTTITRRGNKDLDWGRVQQIDAGIDLEAFGGLSMTLNWFLINRKGVITETSAGYPDFVGLKESSYYENYNEYLINGFELALQYTRKFGDWKVSLGGNAMTWSNTRTKVSNDLYIGDWQKVEGTSNYAYWGFQCLGKFQSEEEIASSALYDSDTRVGDLKYKDVNPDGIIDSNDKVVLGDTTPKLRYAVNLDLSWKGFNLFVVGTGRAFFKTALTNEYFWNGWGDGNYSKFVVENIGAGYPRLGYDKPVNNFVASDFWLVDGSWFKIQTAELGYTLPIKGDKGIKSVKFSIRGSNLLTLSKVKYVDPESTAAGVTEYPLYRTVALGAKLNF